MRRRSPSEVAVGRRIVASLVAAVVLSLAGPAAARDAVTVVGAREVAALAARTLERLGIPGSVRAGGTDGGIAAFCAGTGPDTPDAVGALRPLTDAEIKVCTAAGITAVTDLRLGTGAAVLVTGPDGPGPSIGRRQLSEALLAKVLVDGQLIANPFRTWAEIDPALPDRPIRVVGPAPGGDLYAILLDRVIEPGCAASPGLAALPPEAGPVCRTLRRDGAYVAVEGGDAKVVAALAGDPAAVGVVGLGAAAPPLRRIGLDGVAPDDAAIAAGRYPATFALHLVVKDAHRALVTGLDRLLDALLSEEALGPGGDLAGAGVVAPSAEDRVGLRARISRLARP